MRISFLSACQILLIVFSISCKNGDTSTTVTSTGPNIQQSPNLFLYEPWWYFALSEETQFEYVYSFQLNGRIRNIGNGPAVEVWVRADFIAGDVNNMVIHNEKFDLQNLLPNDDVPFYRRGKFSCPKNTVPTYVKYYYGSE